MHGRDRPRHAAPLAGADFNFDHPDAFDVVEITRCLDSLKRGQKTIIPVYDFTTHSRSTDVKTVKPAEVILFEGILVLHVQPIVERLNMKVCYWCVGFSRCRRALACFQCQQRLLAIANKPSNADIRGHGR